MIRFVGFVSQVRSRILKKTLSQGVSILRFLCISLQKKIMFFNNFSWVIHFEGVDCSLFYCFVLLGVVIAHKGYKPPLLRGVSIRLAGNIPLIAYKVVRWGHTFLRSVVSIIFFGLISCKIDGSYLIKALVI